MIYFKITTHLQNNLLHILHNHTNISYIFYINGKISKMHKDIASVPILFKVLSNNISNVGM